MSKLNKLVAEIIAELLKEEPELLVKRKLSYNEPGMGRPENHVSNEAYSCDEDEVITESSSYVCVTCGERAEHEEIEDNPRMRCSNCGGNQWRIAEVGIEESSTTGGVDGYMTPNAFAAPGQDPKKKKAVRAMDWPVVESVDFKDPEMSPKKKIAYAVKGMREQLMEIENVLDKSVNFKEEAGLKTSDFYKRTHKNLRKIGEQITRIMNKMQTIK